MTCHELRDAIFLHAARAADEAEDLYVRDHLASGCERCNAELAAAAATLGALPLVLPTVEPSRDLRDRLLTRVAAADTRDRAAADTDTPSASPARRPQLVPVPEARPGRFSVGLREVVAAGLAAAIAGLLVYADMGRERTALQHLVDDQSRIVATQGAQLAALDTQLREQRGTLQMLGSSSVAVHSLAGAAPQPGASGRLFWDRERGVWRLFLSGLGQLDKERTYELWIITDDDRKIPAGTFDPDPHGNAALTVELPDSDVPFVLAAITDEPRGGVPQPTGTIQMVGQLKTAG